MSELKVGDVVSYRGNKGVIHQVLDDGKEKYYRIDVTETKIRYLYKDELDSLTDQTTLNENQQIVLEWLKGDESESFKEALGDLYFYVHHGYRVSEPYEKLSEKDFAQVLQVFSQWALEQYEHDLIRFIDNSAIVSDSEQEG